MAANILGRYVWLIGQFRRYGCLAYFLKLSFLSDKYYIKYFLLLILLICLNRIDIDIVSVYNCIKTIFFIILHEILLRFVFIFNLRNNM